MKQNYHMNANTNAHSRAIIHGAKASNTTLAHRFGVSTKTIAKWKSRDFVKDKTSRPKTIHYALNETEREIIRVVRTLTWLELDDLTDSIVACMPNANRSNVYRTLVCFGINRVPQEKKQQASTFKEYEPGYLHIDVTYLPKLAGKKQYLFVAIDRATRVLYFEIYENKTAINAVEFLNNCKDFYPFTITHILTDNGLEFTDKFVTKDKQVSGKHKFDKLCSRSEIEHRLTQPVTPKTNGMVERVNGTIKNATVKAITYQNIDEMKQDLNKFLIFYNFNRGHGGLRKEIKVRTPYEALEYWYNLKPDLFIRKPDMFRSVVFESRE
ncbi:DDE-type integrase/transposase/recombinase [thiotrophic endosymbiont of Bathymodiolus puteoserpentis (Logatchev)]|uniref:DDE-type integrase/transposase/recombinase n=3 Tax=Bacteria TaxID=2 RepID=UPI0010B17DFE|nr:DDE-type integrase/transposase/recombinase [thiotrophic endosymbiont of Bathymodiolus puteoserpentis (Logatchev)]SSC09702.1 putative transposase [thiotrophic endosymbiont of Bathymodiolus puteoserpentis (Logatchev)]SSC09806.1 putative transposase [thiotrophic endosymbiont of Bathymodiolus puteoserpentis (Logatchev)]